MTFIEAFFAIFAELLNVETSLYAALAACLAVVSFLWRRQLRNARQSRIVLGAASLWLAIPAAAAIGSFFRFSGASSSGGVEFSEFGAALSASVLPLVALVSVALFTVGSGVRVNVLGITLPLLLCQFWFSFLAGCAIVGVCA
ncbi:hypothetical protein [Pseudomarimonas arenosa]|uniref:Uncharacterized protein n=1 Tax=Pseudomarimonas arenosa TaxID=2774145 RepID=A0AAW3ZPH1_9GAMM|nr:hypothetical protein [Pseudomarimonas arenosa]MBD8528016.1 hypothetical protein [Pseudomarimonas arenosa]